MTLLVIAIGYWYLILVTVLLVTVYQFSIFVACDECRLIASFSIE